MPQGIEFIVRAVPMGIGATIILDGWALVSARAYGIPKPRWDLVGRWIAGIPRGHLVREKLGQSPPVRGELTIGWIVHYGTGIAYAALLLAIVGLDWSRQPTPGPAIAFGLLTLAAPFLIMQPGMGLGVAASKAPDPTAARLRSVISHTVFGVGLYLSALATRWAIG